MLHLFHSTLSHLPYVTGRPMFGIGQSEPASFLRAAEHARVLAEIRREERAAKPASGKVQDGGLITRLRRVVGLAQ